MKTMDTFARRTTNEAMEKKKRRISGEKIAWISCRAPSLRELASGIGSISIVSVEDVLDRFTSERLLRRCLILLLGIEEVSDECFRSGIVSFEGPGFGCCKVASSSDSDSEADEDCESVGVLFIIVVAVKVPVPGVTKVLGSFWIFGDWVIVSGSSVFSTDCTRTVFGAREFL